MPTRDLPAPDPRDLAPPVRADDDVSLAWLAAAFRRRRLLFLFLALTPAVLTATYLLVKPRTWTATASFVPQGRASGAGELAGLAAQFGIAAPMGDLGQTPAFYVDLVTSRGILGAVVDSTYAVDGGRAESLVARWGDERPTAGERRAAAMDELRERLFTSIGKTGIVSVGVSTPSPELSYRIVQRLTDAISHYNLVARQSRAAAERRFAEERLRIVEGELRGAENDVQRFLESNRTYNTAPQLMFGYERLQRRVQDRSQLRATLRDAVERSRLEEVRDTPVISFLERPEVPVRPDPRGLVMKTLLALFGGVAVGAMVVVALAYLRGGIGAGRALPVARPPTDAGAERPLRTSPLAEPGDERRRDGARVAG